MTNPLLEEHELPPFSQINAEQVGLAVDQLLNDYRAGVESLLVEGKIFHWDSLQQPLDILEDRLSQAWSSVSHMNSVVNSDDLREAYNAQLPKLSELSTWMGQNIDLYNAYKQLAGRDDFSHLDTAQQKVITNALRDFKLSGVALPENKKQRYGELKKRLSEVTSQYSDNVLDATMAWSKLITEEAELVGLSESAKANARQLAEAKGKDGWLLNLEFPSYLPVMTYADSRALRQEVYTAFSTRASEQGPNGGEFDNSLLMYEILSLRHELAQILDFDSYVEYSLATKMAESSDNVISFLEDLAARSKPQAERELAELKAFVKTLDSSIDLQAWDIAYYAEKLRQHRYSISQEALRPWFPAEKAIAGMFAVTSKLYGLTFREIKGVDTWHKEVCFYDVCRDDEVIGRFYLDPYAREHKRGGAWMDVCRTRMIKGEKVQLPVAYLTTNFTPPVGDKPALLTHDEVVTLFHEFGHGLHHLLTQIDYAPVSGISGVAWDAVEMPSQLMENWCWEREGLMLISGHYETGEPLPEEMLEKLLAAKNFQSAMMMMRQLEFSLFDFKMHMNYQPGMKIQSVLDDVRRQVAVVMPPSFNRFQNSFSHIFAGGYAAGYYSYKWAEVLSADAFSLFEENGIFDRATGEKFLHEVLEKGGSREPMELFVAFRGREPKIDALLRHSGIK
ncbi:MAG: oligopeptidase A [Candidatus Endonucleobacter sp. (ex Gigantidas childressi)]|nr:oligopeptidase A [Candidatus Endonucleobacter sp. (ex Gigantidas childressi)]